MLLSELPFEPLGSNAPGPATGISINGVDLANLYAPASAGTASGIVTGFTVAGADIGLAFAGAGTATKLFSTWAGSYTDFKYGQETVVSTVTLTFNTDGTYTTQYGSGRWLAPNLASLDYEIIAEVISGAFDTNLMVAYAQLNINRVLELQVVTGPTQSFAQETAVAKITIRKISEPTTLVSGSVTMVVNAESYGSGAPP